MLDTIVDCNISLLTFFNCDWSSKSISWIEYTEFVLWSSDSDSCNLISSVHKDFTMFVLLQFQGFQCDRFGLSKNRVIGFTHFCLGWSCIAILNDIKHPTIFSFLNTLFTLLDVFREILDADFSFFIWAVSKTGKETSLGVRSFTVHASLIISISLNLIRE